MRSTPIYNALVMTDFLYKIVSQEQWQQSQGSKELMLTDFDSDFIHLARKDQIVHVVQKFWKNQHPLILKLRTSELSGRLVEEVNPGGATKYFHLYSGNIPLASVVEAVTFRAAIDFGSGAIKIQVNVVDLITNQLLAEPLLSTYAILYLTEDMAKHGGMISEAMEHQALAILERFKEEAITIGIATYGYPPEFIGIATEAFRRAHNGADLLKKIEKVLSIPFQILCQDEEGELGFQTAKTCFPMIPEEEMIAWDSGNGSFQFTAKEGRNYLIYRGPLGLGTVRVILSKEMRKVPVFQSHQSGNPISENEAKVLAQHVQEKLLAVPEWFIAKLKSKTVKIVCFGEGESVFFVLAKASATLKSQEFLEGLPLSLKDIQEVLSAYIGYDDERLQAIGLHQKTLTSAILVSTILEYFNIPKIYFKRSLGITPGMLVSQPLS